MKDANDIEKSKYKIESEGKPNKTFGPIIVQRHL